MNLNRSRAGLFATISISFAVLAAGCDKKSDVGSEPPPPPPPVASAKPNACASGGGELKDEVSRDHFPRAAAGFCVDPQGSEKTYGEKGKFSMDDVCTTAFDGECEVYKRFGLKRVVTLRYVDGSGKPNSIEVTLSTFGDAPGAYGMFTKRVVADGDPAVTAAKLKFFQAGGAAAQGASSLWMWKGPYLAELAFVSEDPAVTRDQIEKLSQTVMSAISKEIGDKLPGAADKLPAVKALPEANLIPLGVQFLPKDPLGLAGVGPAAIGFYKEGEKRYRMFAISRDEADHAKDAWKVIKARPGAAGVKDIGDDAAVLTFAEDKKPKVEYVFARKGALIAAVGDEELVLDATAPADKQAALKLTRDEKIAKLRAWLTAAPAPAPGGAPGASSAPAPSAAPSGAPAPKKTPQPAPTM